MVTSSDKREFSRAPVHVRAEITTRAGVTICGRVRDLGMSGIFVDAEQGLPLDTECAVAIILDTGDAPIRLDLHGRVSRIDVQGIALEFDEVDVDSVEHLQNLVRYNAANSEEADREIRDHLGLKRRTG